MNSGQKPLGAQIDPKPSNSRMTAGERTVHAVTLNAETIQPVSDWRVEQAAGPNTRGGTSADSEYCPIVPLGHKNGLYFFISASGELRSIKAEALEAGRGVRALLSGYGVSTDAWCLGNFPLKDGGWSHREAGQWIIDQCNGKGVFDPSSADLRSVGVWRDEKGNAIAHCGDQLVLSDGQVMTPAAFQGKCVMIGAAPIAPPVNAFIDPHIIEKFRFELRALWGWKRDVDADIFLGWIGAASLGGFPEWRSHLYVYGSRGSGKSKLMELAASLLGEFGGSVLNDATEAGLRQSRNNQARPILIDEFEPDQSARNGSKQDSMLALFRRMSGGGGGRVSRGGADHSAVSFRSLGAAYVTSINHIDLEPQDRSRFVLIDLGLLPATSDPLQTMTRLKAFEAAAKSLSTCLRGRMLGQSGRWDETHSAIASAARKEGADARQADTIATILAGRDLVLFDGKVDQSRLNELRPILGVMAGDAEDSGAASEADNAFDFLLSSLLKLDRGVRRTIRELLMAAIDGVAILEVDDPSAALSRAGIHVLQTKKSIGVRVGRTTQVADLYAGTKWQNGAHVSALLNIDGVSRPNGATRVSPNQQHRLVLIPIGLIMNAPTESGDNFH
jgi:energy-coupling factor transporter ATP-binding protein EcfA2